MIYAVIPVHNRLAKTRRCVECLRQQKFNGSVDIVIVDDGSTDGTPEFLEGLADITSSSNRRVRVVTGTGDWWWSKSINKGIAEIKTELQFEDGVLFLNDDVELDSNYLESLLESWNNGTRSIVMSQLVDENDPSIEIASPIDVDPAHLSICANDTRLSPEQRFSRSDVAPGRGTLYPASVFLHEQQIDEKMLPHYMADYEFSIRASQLGFPIVVAHNARVLTDTDWGNTRRAGGLRWRLFAKQSPDLLKAHWQFWRTASPGTGTISLVIRILRYRVIPTLLAIVKNKQPVTK